MFKKIKDSKLDTFIESKLEFVWIQTAVNRIKTEFN